MGGWDRRRRRRRRRGNRLGERIERPGLHKRQQIGRRTVEDAVDAGEPAVGQATQAAPSTAQSSDAHGASRHALELAAVDADHGAGHIRGPLAAQERRHVGVFLGSAVAADRHRRRTGGHHIVGARTFSVGSALVEESCPGGLDPARHDDVGRHAVAAHLIGERLRPGVQAGPQRVRYREVGDRTERTARRRREDAAPAPLPHAGQHPVGDAR